jgi:hypothetical protein
VNLTRRAFATAVGLAPFAAMRNGLAQEEELAVSVTNHSEPEVCAEKDNIQIDFLSPDVRRMRIRAVHPAYIGSVGLDRAEPDWTCRATHPSRARSARRGSGRARISGSSDGHIRAFGASRMCLCA